MCPEWSQEWHHQDEALMQALYITLAGPEVARACETQRL